MQASLRATLQCLKSFSGTDFRADVAAFQVLTLLVDGTDDETVPMAASSRIAAKGTAHRTPIEYEGAPHGLFTSHRQRLTQDVINFLGH